MSFTRYTQVVLAVVGSSLVLSWPLADRFGVRGWTAVAVGAALAVLNTLAAYRLVLWSQGRATVSFFRAILGGMLARMTVLLIAVVFGIKGAGLPAVPFVVSLLAHFVAFLVLETSILSRPAVQPEAR